MIKQTRDVPNLSWLNSLGAAQNKIVILRPLGPDAEEALLRLRRHLEQLGVWSELLRG